MSQLARRVGPTVNRWVITTPSDATWLKPDQTVNSSPSINSRRWLISIPAGHEGGVGIL